MKRIGVIGLGYRVHKGVIPFLAELSNDVKIVAAADPAEEQVLARAKEEPIGYADDFKVYPDVDAMFASEDLDGIIIGTRCSLHTEMAIRAMDKKVPIFLEKPVCTTMEDLLRLKEANDKYNPQVVVSFPLRFSALSEFAREIIQSGQIGDVLEARAFNDVRYGRGYYHGWYRDDSETGGLWLQKATHDFDYLNYILGDRFTEVFARETNQLFKGDMPAGLKCADCEKNMTCPEAPFIIKNKYMDNVAPDYMCCFAVDTGNHDCGTALLKCESGAIVSYSQNFFARHKAASRGANFYGYKGTLKFDWYQNEVKVFMHTSPRVETYTFDDKGSSHFGGDLKLAELFLAMLNGTSKTSYLREGLESAAICLMAKESCQTGKNVEILKV